MKKPNLLTDEAVQERLKNAPKPRVTEEGILSKIQSVTHTTIRDGDTPIGTLCAIKLWNGWVSTGFSAPASPENFDPEIGRKYSYDQAFKPLWQLEGYLLREKLYREENQ